MRQGDALTKSGGGKVRGKGSLFRTMTASKVGCTSEKLKLIWFFIRFALPLAASKVLSLEKAKEKFLFLLLFARLFVPLQAIMVKNEVKTNQQFEQTIAECRQLFEKKLHDYGASWRILRPSSLTDQLFIKAKRIRSLEIKKESLVGDGIRPEFVALINYGIVGLIQIYHGFSDTVDIDNEKAMSLYDQYAGEALELMKRKNHDYDEAWRGMRVSSYTDFILTDRGGGRVGHADGAESKKWHQEGRRECGTYRAGRRPDTVGIRQGR